ncbi:hypothetical protein A8C56_18025 [Niabella ginsenosidivorans]|uniref:SnoaL-like domain-containing protein n=1 Tax=Niabella ginsenosidivorans TaxID=1176587 RepID=A0A1A9I6E0_9BACT|nr:nuclear transport factor 2 family protein [Niabella ginsenosidivorans]ANH82619.1 hypothetical protein A8C56_18025 [Niabella ginsenosidivorans]
MNKKTELVKQFVECLNKEDFEGAQNCLYEDFVFEGVLGRRAGALVYINEMKQMKLKYRVLQVFEAADDVCLWYMIDMGGRQILASGWYHICNEQIHSLKVLFDPRPLLG